MHTKRAVDEVVAERERATAAAINNHSFWSEDAMNMRLYPRVCFSLSDILVLESLLEMTKHT